MRYPASWEKRRDARLIYAIRICILYLRTRARAGFSSVFLVHVSPPSLTITAAGASRGHGKTIARQFARGMAEKNHSRRAFSLPELILSSICGRFRYFPPSPPLPPPPIVRRGAARSVSRRVSLQFSTERTTCIRDKRTFSSASSYAISSTRSTNETRLS